MSDLYIHEKMLKNIRERRARLGELAITEQDLKDLLKKVTDDE